MTPPENTPDPNVYMAPLKRVVDFWTRIWPNNFFTFKHGRGFVDIYDSRPLKLEGGVQYREYHLEGFEAFIFSYCKILRTLAQIKESLQKEDFQFTENHLNSVLENFIQRQWMLREDNFFLTLATNSGLTASQQLSFERMDHLHKSYLPPSNRP